jgi:hypothetical protein
MAFTFPESKVLSELILLPLALLVILVGQNRADKKFAIFVVDEGDQPELVAAYVEYHELVRWVRGSVSRSNIGELLPFCLSYYLVPLLQGGLGTWVPFPEFP